MPYKNKEDQKKNHHRWHKENRERILKLQKNYRNKIRDEVLSHYSGGKTECACCGEQTKEFLSVDHINGGGTKHRKKIGNGYTYLWLIKNNFPKGFRVLCHNCNQAISSNGKCPHILMRD